MTKSTRRTFPWQSKVSFFHQAARVLARPFARLYVAVIFAATFLFCKVVRCGSLSFDAEAGILRVRRESPFLLQVDGDLIVIGNEISLLSDTQTLRADGLPKAVHFNPTRFDAQGSPIIETPTPNNNRILSE